MRLQPQTQPPHLISVGTPGSAHVVLRGEPGSAQVLTPGPLPVDVAEAATAYAVTARAAGADVRQAVAAVIAAYEHGYVVG